MNNVVSMAEHKYKKNAVHFNLALDNYYFTKQKKRNIRREMELGYLKMRTEYYSK